MSEPIKVHRPMMQNNEMQPQDSRGQEPRGNSKIPWIILGVIVVVLILVAILFRDRLFSGSQQMQKNTTTTTNTAANTSKASGYQAVFLSNGQVYFGKMSRSESQLPMLKDIYYLQVTQPPLQGSQQQGQQSQAQPQLSLVKLGNELHGPVDEMVLNRDHILFWEDMKEDSKVVQAIKEYKANPPATGTQQAPTK